MLELHSYFEKLKFCKDMENGLCWEGKKSIWMETKGNHINEKWLHASSEDGKMKMNSRYFGDKQDWWLNEREWKLRKKSSFLNWPQVRMVVSLVEYKQRESGMSNRTDFFFSDSFLHFYWKVRLLSISHQASFSGFQQCKEDLNSKWVQIST